MKRSDQLAVIAVLNLVAAVGVTVWAVVWYGSVPHVLTLPLLMAAAAGATASVGLWNRRDWGRRWAIVSWLFYMPYMVPIGLSWGFGRFGAWGAVAGLALTIGIPATVVFYLSQPQIKQAVGAPDESYSRAKTTGLILFTLVAGLLFFGWLANEIGKAVGGGIR